jgi:muramoyltetrapeptide carboxypeptidase
MKLFKPARLRKGEKIGVVAPAGSVDEGQLNTGVKAILQAGFQVELAPEILGRKGYLAGEKEQRAKALQDFFHRPDIHAIFCARGGFGCAQLLPLLDAEAIRRHPKIFVGYSDISILLNWLLQRCGMVTFHGPMVANGLAQGLEGRNKDFFWGTLLGEKGRWQIPLGGIIRPGIVQAQMVGGCLSTLVTTLGTPFEIETADKILFLEDTGERPYRIERMLTHLQMAGKLKGIVGLVFGSFTDCGGQEGRGLAEIIQELFRDAPYPVVEGLAAGHGKENLLFPLGAQMALDGTAGVLSLLESPVA